MGSRLRALQPDKLDPGCKMDSKLVFPLTILLLATIIHSGSGIKCYQCNSYEDALCADPFFHDELNQDGSWLPVTLDHPHLSNGGQSNLSREDGDRIQQTHKNFPQKNRCDHQTNLFDLRSCLQMRKFEVVHKPSGGPAFSPELLSTQSLGFCSATRL